MEIFNEYVHISLQKRNLVKDKFISKTILWCIISYLFIDNLLSLKSVSTKKFYDGIFFDNAFFIVTLKCLNFYVF